MITDKAESSVSFMRVRLKRFPDFNVFTEIQYNPTPEDVKVWESRTYDIDNTNWTLLDFADRIKTYDPERDLDR